MSKATRMRRTAEAARQAATTAAALSPSSSPTMEELVACCEGQIPPHDAITARAREIWEARGRPDDQDLDIWIAAEADLLRRPN